MADMQAVGAAKSSGAGGGSETFKVTVLAPDGVLWAGAAEMLIAPGAAGEFTVLPAHIPMISLLSTGSIRVFEKKASPPQAFDIAHGVCSLLPDEVILLADVKHRAEENANLAAG